MAKLNSKVIPVLLLAIAVVTLFLNAHYSWHLFDIIGGIGHWQTPYPYAQATVLPIATTTCSSGFEIITSWQSHNVEPFWTYTSNGGTISCPSTIYEVDKVLSCHYSFNLETNNNGVITPLDYCSYVSVYDASMNKLSCNMHADRQPLVAGQTYTFTINPLPVNSGLYKPYYFDIISCKQIMLAVSLTPSKNSYNSVEDVPISVKLIPDIGTFSQPVQLTATVHDFSYPYSALGTATATTDATGAATITLKGGFANNRASGDYPVTVSFTNPINSSTTSGVVSVSIKGAITMVSTAESYDQYNIQPIVSYVTVTDSQGAPVDPSLIQQLKSTSTMPSGSVVSSVVEYLGNGKYKVTSTVTGNGVYNAQISFTYGGFTFTATPLQINIGTPKVSIDVSKINPVANLNDEDTYTVSVFDSLGSVITPDNIYVDVRYPDGSQAAMIPMSQINSVSTGVYQFSFKFTQIEKYTFNVYAEKTGYAKGSAMAAVAVNTPTNTGTGIQGLGIYANLIIIGIAILIAWQLAKKLRLIK